MQASKLRAVAMRIACGVIGVVVLLDSLALYGLSRLGGRLTAGIFAMRSVRFMAMLPFAAPLVSCAPAVGPQQFRTEWSELKGVAAAAQCFHAQNHRWPRSMDELSAFHCPDRTIEYHRWYFRYVDFVPGFFGEGIELRYQPVSEPFWARRPVLYVSELSATTPTEADR